MDSLTRKPLFGCLSIVLGILVAFGLSELGLRAFGIGYGGAPVESDPILHHVHPKNYTYVTYHVDAQWGGDTVYYDRDGRVSHPNRPAKPNAPCRVAFMGDSFTEGSYLAFDASFVGRLFSASPCEVRNYGMTSYSPVLYLLQWRTQVRTFKPDLVVLQLYSNDPRDDADYAGVARRDGNGRIVAVPGPRQSSLILFARNSYVFRLIRMAELKTRWWMGFRPPVRTTGAVVNGFVEEFPDIPPLTAQSLSEFARDIESQGAKLALFVVPSKYRLVNGGRLPGNAAEFSDKWKDWAAMNDVLFINLVPPFSASAAAGQFPFLERDIHFNAIGNEVTARTICQSLPSYFSQPCL